eukprot:315546-Lingulodinium_polyedra.AAC.1
MPAPTATLRPALPGPGPAHRGALRGGHHRYGRRSRRPGPWATWPCGGLFLRACLARALGRTLPGDGAPL